MQRKAIGISSSGDNTIISNAATPINVHEVFGWKWSGQCHV